MVSQLICTLSMHISLDPRPFHLQFLITYSMQNGGGRLGSIYCVNDLNVYLDRRREESLTETMILRYFLALSIQVLESGSFALIIQEEDCIVQTMFFA